MPKLNASVIRQIDSTDLERLFAAHNSHVSQVLGESMTKEFLLTHLFEVNHLMRKPETFWREAFGLLYRGRRFAPVLGSVCRQDLDGPGLGVFARRGPYLRRALWPARYKRHGLQPKSGGVEIEQAGADPGLQATKVFDIPFDHVDIRVIVDTLFLEGALQPVNARPCRPHCLIGLDWGAIQSPTSLRDLVEGGIRSMAARLPEPEATHRDWTDAARALG